MITCIVWTDDHKLLLQKSNLTVQQSCRVRIMFYILFNRWLNNYNGAMPKNDDNYSSSRAYE